MIPSLTTSIDRLLRTESARVEFKAKWDDVTGGQALRTICAFANDLFNLNGGYLIVGVEEREDGHAQRPVRGVTNPDQVQRHLAEQCRQIEPVYAPILSVEDVDERQIVVAWCPPGPNGPYKAPVDRKDRKAFFVRSGSATMEAKGDHERQLMQATRRIPYDDTPHYGASVTDIASGLVRQHLEASGSRLAPQIGQQNDEEVYLKMGLLSRANGHHVPRNIALLFFNHHPEQFFRGAVIEIARYAFGGDVLEERTITGPLADQLRLAVNEIRSRNGSLRRKVEGRIEAQVTHEYPVDAVEEAIANALYHRSYEPMDVEPTKIHIHPDRMDIISYPGPVPGFGPEQLQSSAWQPPPARNRRIGEFLKELDLAEQRGTGLSKIRSAMLENGSPEPTFHFDEARTSFMTRLRVHPDFLRQNQLRPILDAWVAGDRRQALQGLRQRWNESPEDPQITQQLLDFLFQTEAIEEARRVMDGFLQGWFKRAVDTHETILLYAREMAVRRKTVDWNELYRHVDLKADPGVMTRLAKPMLIAGAQRTAYERLIEVQGELAGDVDYTYVLAIAKYLVDDDGEMTDDVVRLARFVSQHDDRPDRRKAAAYLEAKALRHTTPLPPELADDDLLRLT